MEVADKLTDKLNKIIVWITTIILLGLWFYSLSIDNQYKNDFFFLMLLLWAVYLIRNKIKLHPLHFLFGASFLILHDLGMFGLYNNFYFGLEYDLYLHMFFGFLASLILYRTFTHVGSYNKWVMFIAIITIILGFSAFHELFEYGGALLFGEGEGVLYIGAGDLDEWDTQKDMLNNLIGALIGLFIYTSVNFFSKNNKV